MTERKMIQTKQNKVIRMDFWTVLWHGLPVVALFIWGAFCITNNLWYDEAYSASMVSLSWKRLIYFTATDDHSPFYYVLLKLFYHLCGVESVSILLNDYGAMERLRNSGVFSAVPRSCREEP